MESNDKYDIKFRELFQKGGLEEPSHNFTSKTMDKILSDSPETEKNSVLRRFPFSGLIWIVVFSVAFIGIAIMIVYNINVFNNQVFSTITPLFLGIIQSFGEIFRSFQVSSTTIVIIGGFVGIVILERILNRFNVTKNLFLSF